MLRSKWLFLSALTVMVPPGVVLWIASVQAYMAADISLGWRLPGRLPAGATSSLDLYLFTLFATAAWCVFAWKVFRMFRSSRSGDKQ